LQAELEASSIKDKTLNCDLFVYKFNLLQNVGMNSLVWENNI